MESKKLKRSIDKLEDEDVDKQSVNNIKRLKLDHAKPQKAKKNVKHKRVINSEPWQPDEWWQTVWYKENDAISHVLKQIGLPSKEILAYVSAADVVLPIPVQLDRVRGALRGAIMGDSLGVPHEFPRWMKCPYTGLTEHKFTVKVGQRFGHPVRVLAPGQYSDDTEMMLCLMRSIIHKRRFDLKDVVQRYIAWTHSNQPSVGSNTRLLFKINTSTKSDPTGYAHYQKQFAKVTGVSAITANQWINQTSDSFQSDGSLMRCAPLACYTSTFRELIDVAKQDIWCSNPSRFVLSLQMIYLWILFRAVRGTDAPEIWNDLVQHIAPTIQDKLLKRVVDHVIHDTDHGVSDRAHMKPPIHPSECKGWLLHGFVMSLTHLKRTAVDKSGTATYTQVMQWVIKDHPNSDTDTNACIVGAIVGAFMGWERLSKEPNVIHNWPIIVASTMPQSKSEVPRTPEYRIHDLETLENKLVDLSRSR
jgi:ADP-ribosyl-[dinitrogen reductase] hydrolase